MGGSLTNEDMVDCIRTIDREFRRATMAHAIRPRNKRADMLRILSMDGSGRGYIAHAPEDWRRTKIILIHSALIRTKVLVLVLVS